MTHFFPPNSCSCAPTVGTVLLPAQSSRRAGYRVNTTPLTDTCRFFYGLSPSKQETCVIGGSKLTCTSFIHSGLQPLRALWGLGSMPSTNGVHILWRTPAGSKRFTLSHQIGESVRCSRSRPQPQRWVPQGLNASGNLFCILQWMGVSAPSPNLMHALFEK